MKTKIFLSFLFLSSLLIAQPDLTVDSIVVKTSHDTIYVWDYNAWEQCAFQLDYSVETADSIITITQIDTAEDAATCYGYHDFVVPVINLNEGNYRIDIYRDCLYEDVKFIKSFQFEYRRPGWEENVVLSPDSIFISNYHLSDSCNIINNSDQGIYLDSIYNKSYSSYYYDIKRDGEYEINYFRINSYGQVDSIHMQLNPKDTLTFFIVSVDVCPICKRQYDGFLKDTLIFVFSTDSNQTTKKQLLLDSDISLGIEDYKTNVSSFYLSQNFPNPFNPNTTIKYSIPKSCFVTLKIYDLLGKEIMTLVNEEKSVGNYEINFDGKNLSSGVYFYRIQAGSFSDAKKFILLR